MTEDPKDDLIKNSDLAKALGLKSADNHLLLNTIGKITGIHKLNEEWARLKSLPPDEIIKNFLAHHQIKVVISDADFAKIPKNDPFIAIANHPFGALDGLILIHLLHTKRPDFKVQANFLLQKLDALKDFFIPVNPLEGHKTQFSSVAGVKKSLEHIKNGGCLGVFPAGEVSSFQISEKRIADRQWQHSSVKFIQKSKVKVLPIYFDGRNSNFFQMIGLLHPLLRTAILPSELFKKENKEIRVRIGSPIPKEEIQNFSSIDQLGKFLRSKTYFLGTTQKISKFFIPPLKFPAKIEPINPNVPKELVYSDIAALHHTDKHLLSRSNYDVFLCNHYHIPNALQQIGVLREHTYRDIGEGTNRAKDLDEFDLLYKHLILWDNREKEIAGAYRIGFGNEIMPAYGFEGFYTNTLFKFTPPFKKYLSESIEMGRSFIVKHHQQKPLPLFTLWSGIEQILAAHQTINYIIGPVSISNHFSKLSKSLMVQFVKKYYFDHEIAAYVSPRKEFRFKLGELASKAIETLTKDDIKKMDQIISDLEISGQKVPILLKKYLKQNAKIIGFNVDPKFNNALDALMILDVKSPPAEGNSLA